MTQVNVSDYATEDTDSSGAHIAKILKNVKALAEGSKKVVEDLGMNTEDPRFMNMFYTIFSDARNSFNETVFQATGSYQ